MSERSPEQPVVVDELIARKAAAIATFVGGDYDMQVVIGPEGSGWHWDFDKNVVNMDLHDLLYESEEVIKGVASHEGNHIIASRAEYVKDMWREPGFAFGFNAVEDPRINTAGIHIRPGTRDWIKAYIERDLAEGGGLNYQHLGAAAQEQLGHIPSHMKWGAEMIRYWHARELADMPLADDDRQLFLDDIPDEDVRETVAKTIDAFEEYYHTIPDSKAETDVRRAAAQSAATFKQKIWPEYEKLVEQAYQDQAAADMLEDMLESEQSQNGQSGQDGQGGQESPVQIPFDSLPQDIQDEIRDKMQQGQPGQQSGSESGEGQPGSESSEQSDGDSGQGSGSPDGQAEAGPQVPWDQLSDSAKDAVRQAYNDLDEDSQADYQQQANQELAAAEEAANEQLCDKLGEQHQHDENSQAEGNSSKGQDSQSGQSSDSGGSKSDTPDQTDSQSAVEAQQASLEDERQARERQKQIEQMIKQMQKQREVATDKLEPNVYHSFLNDPEVKTIMLKLDSEFKRIFTPNELPNVRHTYSGLRPSMRRAMQFEADPRRSDIFETKGRPTEKSHRFLWNGDLSGSMSGIIDLLFKAVVINVELANKHGLETAVTGFSDGEGMPYDGFAVFKDFEPRRLDRQGRERLGRMPHSGGGGTPLMRATQLGHQLLKARNDQARMKSNFFQTFTDGGPTDASVQDLAKLVRKLQADRDIMISGFGIGYSTGYVNDIYPQLPKVVHEAVAKKIGKPTNDVSNSFENVSDFARAFVVIMGYQVEQPELFYT